MRPIDRVLLIWSVAALAFALVYGLEPPAPRYYPLERDWSWTPLAGPGMGWYGRTAWAGLAAALAAAVTSLTTRSRRDAPPRLLASRLAWIAWLGLTLLGGVILVHEFRRWGVL